MKGFPTELEEFADVYRQREFASVCPIGKYRGRYNIRIFYLSKLLYSFVMLKFYLAAKEDELTAWIFDKPHGKPDV